MRSKELAGPRPTARRVERRVPAVERDRQQTVAAPSTTCSAFRAVRDRARTHVIRDTDRFAVARRRSRVARHVGSRSAPTKTSPPAPSRPSSGARRHAPARARPHRAARRRRRRAARRSRMAAVDGCDRDGSGPSTPSAPPSEIGGRAPRRFVLAEPGQRRDGRIGRDVRATAACHDESAEQRDRSSHASARRGDRLNRLKACRPRCRRPSG